jgi:hypothetical protein
MACLCHLKNTLIGLGHGKSRTCIENTSRLFYKLNNIEPTVLNTLIKNMIKVTSFSEVSAYNYA